MKACVIHAAEDLRIEDWPDPTPGPGEVLVALAAAGICGSDQHYFLHGRVGEFVVRQPLVPGHEASARVLEVGPGVIPGVAPGQLVAINPAAPCGDCTQCRRGHPIHCSNNGFAGSASRYPHSQGFFRERFTVAAARCVVAPDHVEPGRLAFAEPLSVALHAVNRAGGVIGRNVLIAGGRTIGLCIALAARALGAARITVADPSQFARERAREIGVDATFDPLSEANKQAVFGEAGGLFDIAFEASGNGAAFDDCAFALARMGTLVQVGVMAPDQGPKRFNLIMAKELCVRGTFRFAEEFAVAVTMVSSGRIDVGPLLSRQFPIAEAGRAFELAVDQNQSTKVQIVAGD